jgi:hypothetical protein
MWLVVELICQYSAFAILLFKLAALFLWIIPRFASLSIWEATSGNFSPASLPDFISFSFWIALRVVLQ